MVNPRTSPLVSAAQAGGMFRSVGAAGASAGGVIADPSNENGFVLSRLGSSSTSPLTSMGVAATRPLEAAAAAAAGGPKHVLSRCGSSSAEEEEGQEKMCTLTGFMALLSCAITIGTDEPLSPPPTTIPKFLTHPSVNKSRLMQRKCSSGSGSSPAGCFSIPSLQLKNPAGVKHRAAMGEKAGGAGAAALGGANTRVSLEESAAFNLGIPLPLGELTESSLEIMKEVPLTLLQNIAASFMSLVESRMRSSLMALVRQQEQLQHVNQSQLLHPVQLELHQQKSETTRRVLQILSNDGGGDRGVAASATPPVQVTTVVTSFQVLPTPGSAKKGFGGSLAGRNGRQATGESSSSTMGGGGAGEGLSPMDAAATSRDPSDCLMQKPAPPGSEEEDEMILPLVFETILDLSILGQLSTVTIRTPATIAATFAPGVAGGGRQHQDNTDRSSRFTISTLEISLDNRALLHSLMQHARQAVKKAMALATSMATGLAAQPVSTLQQQLLGMAASGSNNASGGGLAAATRTSRSTGDVSGLLGLIRREVHGNNGNGTTTSNNGGSVGDTLPSEFMGQAAVLQQLQQQQQRQHKSSSASDLASLVLQQQQQRLQNHTAIRRNLSGLASGQSLEALQHLLVGGRGGGGSKKGSFASSPSSSYFTLERNRGGGLSNSSSSRSSSKHRSATELALLQQHVESLGGDRGSAVGEDGGRGRMRTSGSQNKLGGLCMSPSRSSSSSSSSASNLLAQAAAANQQRFAHASVIHGRSSQSSQSHDLMAQAAAIMASTTASSSSRRSQSQSDLATALLASTRRSKEHVSAVETERAESLASRVALARARVALNLGGTTDRELTGSHSARLMDDSRVLSIPTSFTSEDVRSSSVTCQRGETKSRVDGGPDSLNSLADAVAVRTREANSVLSTSHAVTPEDSASRSQSLLAASASSHDGESFRADKPVSAPSWGFGSGVSKDDSAKAPSKSGMMPPPPPRRASIILSSGNQAPPRPRCSEKDGNLDQGCSSEYRTTERAVAPRDSDEDVSHLAAVRAREGGMPRKEDAHALGCETAQSRSSPSLSSRSPRLPHKKRSFSSSSSPPLSSTVKEEESSSPNDTKRFRISPQAQI